MHHCFVAVLLQSTQQPLHLSNTEVQLLGRSALRDDLLVDLLQRHQPVTFGLGHQ